MEEPMHIMRSIGQTERAYVLFRNARLEQYGLTDYQGLYLRTVCVHPGITQEEMASKLVFNKSSVSRQLAALEQDGLILRKRCEKDKRSIRVYPTEKGEALLPIIRETARDFFAEISKELTEEEKELLDQLCQKLCEGAKGAIRQK
ncbi:MAG: MarR family transcriptional regulator [Ruminococcaceae bacterium]|nr:MarR family transcriptional regulator [Oscillospiraceae bacterium]